MGDDAKERGEMKWRPLTWFEFCSWMQGKTVASPRSCVFECNEVQIAFDDGTAAMVESVADADEPGEVRPPTVKVWP